MITGLTHGRQPYEMLLELEALGRSAGTGSEAPGDEWEGMAFRVAGRGYLANAGTVREVLPAPRPLTRVPGGPRWLRGIAQVRGELLPVNDLRRVPGLAAASAGEPERSDSALHMLVIEQGELVAGVLADEVLGLRRFPGTERVPAGTWQEPVDDRCVLAVFRRGAELWLALDLPALLAGEAGHAPSGRQAAG